MAKLLPDSWIPPSEVRWVKRVVLHWTAGGYNASEYERKHYHILVDGTGKIVKGMPPIGRNAVSVRGLNTGTVAIALCGMHGAQEGGPYGEFPIKAVQVERACQAAAEVLHRYDLPVNEETCLDHAAVTWVYGKKQLGKWDIQELPYDERYRGREVTELLRRKTIWYYERMEG